MAVQSRGSTFTSGSGNIGAPDFLKPRYGRGRETGFARMRRTDLSELRRCSRHPFKCRAAIAGVKPFTRPQLSSINLPGVVPE
jgi:hypothetical protein